MRKLLVIVLVFMIMFTAAFVLGLAQADIDQVYEQEDITL